MNECTVHLILEYMLTTKKISDLGCITTWRKTLLLQGVWIQHLCNFQCAICINNF